MTGSLINQSLAFQALGSYINACQILTQALLLDDWICPNSVDQDAFLDKSFSDLKQLLQKRPNQPIEIIGFYNLANVLRLTGQPEISYAILQHCLAALSSLSITSEIKNQLLLNLANTEFALYSQAKNKYELTDEPTARKKALIFAKSKIKASQKLYQELSLQNNDISLPANLNNLKLLLDVKYSSILPPTDTSLNKSILKIVDNLLNHFDKSPAIHTINSIYFQLNFSQALIKIFQDSYFQNSLPTDLLSVALSLSQEALTIAKKLNNQRAISYALGTLGYFSIASGQSLKAENYFDNAMLFAQSVQAWELAYEWQWELGRLSRLSGKIEQANQFYGASLKNLDKIRGDVLLINPEIQFAFKEKVEPLYHEYMDLLLSENQPNQNYLAQITKLQEQLNFAEIEYFLRCGKLIVPSLNSNYSQQFKKLSTIIYLIKLTNTIEIIVKTPHSIYRHTVDFSSIFEPLNNILDLLQKEKSVGLEESQITAYCQAIYNSLFKPIKKYLPNSGTLGFVLDSYFQNLPLTLLHDGEKYLIQTYSFSIASSSKQLEQSISKPAPTLIGGISKISPSFNNSSVPTNLQPLPEVKAEIENIKKNIVSATTLIDAEFTRDKFQQNIENNSFSVVHLSTHAQFSSDPEQTFILAWDTPLKVKNLKFLVQNKGNLELLVLSACQTAKGDKRSTLGIAGIAAQAGTRGILASLWLVDAESTTVLMEKFYQGFNRGLTKAEALRLAQLHLLQSDKYFHPYYWAGFILVGG